MAGMSQTGRYNSTTSLQPLLLNCNSGIISALKIINYDNTLTTVLKELTTNNNMDLHFFAIQTIPTKSSTKRFDHMPCFNDLHI